MFVFASLLGMVHEATTSHVRCAAHGELVDGLPVAALALAGQPGDTVADAADGARSGGDEHCLLASALRASRIAPSPPAPIGVAELHHALPASAHAAGARVYRLAPKTSPPA